jgi:hypothetical protein
MNVTVNHWRYEDGTTIPNPGSRFQLDPIPRGWYCWAYTDNNKEFEEWMKRMCPTTACIPRFNSGDPMYTIYMTDDSEATIFKLTWV